MIGSYSSVFWSWNLQLQIFERPTFADLLSSEWRGLGMGQMNKNSLSLSG